MAQSDSCPPEPEGGATALPILSDRDLVAEGWVRRHMVDPARAAESVELYTSMGFEVKVHKLTPEDFGPQCAACVESACSSYAVIYTRKKNTD